MCTYWAVQVSNILLVFQKLCECLFGGIPSDQLSGFTKLSNGFNLTHGLENMDPFLVERGYMAFIISAEYFTSREMQALGKWSK